MTDVLTYATESFPLLSPPGGPRGEFDPSTTTRPASPPASFSAFERLRGDGDKSGDKHSELRASSSFGRLSMLAK